MSSGIATEIMDMVDVETAEIMNALFSANLVNSRSEKSFSGGVTLLDPGLLGENVNRG